MMIPLAASVARRRFANVAIQQQRRTMAGGHAPAPKWEGIDKVVRGYFPQDYQRESQIVSLVSKIPDSLSHPPLFSLTVSMAILGGYTGLFVLIKIGGAISGTKEEPAPVVASSSPVVATTGIPAIDTPEFDKYLETDAFYKMLDSDEQLAKVVADMK
jgi:hypothetical protein